MIFPSYLRPDDDAVQGDWLLRVGDREVAGPTVEGWDYSERVHARFACRLDLDALLDDIGLEDDAQIRLLLRWRSTSSGIRGVSDGSIVSHGESREEVVLDGAELGGDLLIDAVLILDSAGRSPTALAPHRPGSILWSQRKKLELEGSRERFPVELISFRRAGLRGPKGAWSLKWDSQDLEHAVGSALRLQMNIDNPTSHAAAKAPDDLKNAQIMSVLRWDISRQLIVTALDDEEHFHTLEWPERSLGAALAARIQTVFPGLSLDECRVLRRMHREDFETSLQTATGLFG